MAVFGVPVLHEDDALRAVRSALEIQHRLKALNSEFEKTWGVHLAHRIGINTGEVFIGKHFQGELFIPGDVVNSTKRLEEAAIADEILVGESTSRLVRDAIILVPSGPRNIKHGATINAYIVVAPVTTDRASGHHPQSVFIGREHERALIQTLFDKVGSDRTCHLLTVIGDAGVGKSRLVREFTAALANDVTILHGSCLSYGEGITYRPLAEIVRQITRTKSIDPSTIAEILTIPLAGDQRAALVSDRIAEALGAGRVMGGRSEEIFWAVRKLFESLARAGPVIVVIDNVHWAESTFLDLIEHIVDISRDFPILIICIARPELLDTRPSWGNGKPNATSIYLEPLNDVECRTLISQLLKGLPPSAEVQIARAAGGNPLFAEELVAMLVDDAFVKREKDCWTVVSDLSALPVPTTIHTLIAARLEGLPEHERVYLTTAAVEGVVFHRSAVSTLVSSTLVQGLDEGLAALVRRDLIRPAIPEFANEQAFSFRHILIREAAYRSLSKGTRAELHEQYATWLELTAKERWREYQEIVGYHLEQAFLNRVALRSPDIRSASIATRAAERLEAAGRRALLRSDLPAAIGLLDRVTRLLDSASPKRIELLIELGGAQIEGGRLAEAGRVLDEAEQLAATIGDVRLISHALVQQQFLRLLRVQEGGLEEAARTASRAIPIFEQYGDDLGICHARRLEAWLYWNEARAADACAAWERAAIHAQRAQDRHEYHEILTWVASTLWFGPTPADEGIRRCEAMRIEVRESPESEAAILRQLACLNAIAGNFKTAREQLAKSNAVYADLGLTLYVASSDHEAVVELLAGNPVAAEQSARAGYRALEEMGERAFRSTIAASLALTILAQGRDEEAEQFAVISAQLASSGDLVTQVLWRRVRARVLAHRMELKEAEALAREAVTISERTDFLNDKADALIDLSHVLEISHRNADAIAVTLRALSLYEQKGNLIAGETARQRLGALNRL
jgi:predicted ATPase